MTFNDLSKIFFSEIYSLSILYLKLYIVPEDDYLVT